MNTKLNILGLMFLLLSISVFTPVTVLSEWQEKLMTSQDYHQVGSFTKKVIFDEHAGSISLEGITNLPSRLSEGKTKAFAADNLTVLEDQQVDLLESLDQSLKPVLDLSTLESRHPSIRLSP